MQLSPADPDFAVFHDRNRRTFIKPISQRAVEWLVNNTELICGEAATAWQEVAMPPEVFMKNMPDDFIFAMPTAEELFGLQRGTH